MLFIPIRLRFRGFYDMWWVWLRTIINILRLYLYYFVFQDFLRPFCGQENRGTRCCFSGCFSSDTLSHPGILFLQQNRMDRHTKVHGRFQVAQPVYCLSFLAFQALLQYITECHIIIHRCHSCIHQQIPICIAPVD